MKIGDMVEHSFTQEIKRRGVILDIVGSLIPDTKYCRVSWFPHPDLPVFGEAIYTDLTIDCKLKVISSI